VRAATALVALLLLAGAGCGSQTAEKGQAADTEGHQDVLAASVKLAEKRAYEGAVQSLIMCFEAETGKLPSSLDELYAAGYKLPPVPQGFAVSYVPDTGMVVLKEVE